MVVKRAENLSDVERADLAEMLAILPRLAVLRQFADQAYGIFDGAASRRDVVASYAEFLSVPEPAKAIRRLKALEFDKVAGYLDRPEGLRMRTNNHIERTNQALRVLEKVRHGWDRRHTLVRFLALKHDEIWNRSSSPRLLCAPPLGGV